MQLNNDRGTILRITFDILYPNGQMKTVAMSMADYDEWKNSGIIAFGDKAIGTIIKNGIAGCDTSVDIEELWDQKEKDAAYKPAMLIIDSDGKVTPKCGAHKSSGHAEKDNPVSRFM